MNRIIIALFSICGVITTAAASDSITIYSKMTPGQVDASLYRPIPGQNNLYNPYSSVPGYAMVRHKREIEIPNKQAQVGFTDVASLIDPTTVAFKSLTHENTTHVLEQNFLFDLVSQSKLLTRYLGQTLTIGPITGELLSFTSDKVLLKASDGKVHMTDYPSVFPELPGGLITQPTLEWMISTEHPGTHEVEVSYQTEGITWWADYNLIFTAGDDANSGVLDLGAWVSIVNQTGANFTDAKLKLVAGDVQRASSGHSQPEMMDMAHRKFATLADGAGFEEKAFFEYHLYTLGRPTTIGNNTTKQIELFETVYGIPTHKELIFNGLGRRNVQYYRPNTSRGQDNSNKKVDIYLNFDNTKENQLGVPMPAGRVRVSKLDSADNSLEFIGEHIIDHTPKDEKIRIKLGSAFDVVGERTVIDFKQDVTPKTAQVHQNHIYETIEITIKNHKADNVDVIIEEPMHRWSNWQITNSNATYKKINAELVHFPVTVPKDGEVTVTYTVDYFWEQTN